MTHGIDTDFLEAAEIRHHPFHRSADALLRTLLTEGHDFALAPQTLAEFIHIVTDPKRMPQPLSMSEAIQRAEHWWMATESTWPQETARHNARCNLPTKWSEATHYQSCEGL